MSMFSFFLWWRMVERKTSLSHVFSSEQSLFSLKSKCDITLFSIFLSLDQHLKKPEKRSYIYSQVSNNSLLIYSLFTSWIYQPKIKCKGGVSYFSKNKKIQTVKNRKNNFFFQLFHFRNSQFFLYGLFQKMLNVSWEHSFKDYRVVSRCLPRQLSETNKHSFSITKSRAYVMSK